MLNRIRVPLLIFLSVSLFVIPFLGIFDVVNFDNALYSLINHLLGQTKPPYFDFPFVQTILSLLEILGLFLAVITSFYILGEEQKNSREKTKLAYQPLAITPDSINIVQFEEVSITVHNIGGGPALFTRVSFVEVLPDEPGNATLKFDQPHSQYLGINMESSKIIFDSRKFYTFLTGSDRGGNLGADRMNCNNQQLREELNGLIKNRINQEFWIYIHSVDILGDPMTFGAKYVLCSDYDSVYNSVFHLKRMEIKEIKR